MGKIFHYLVFTFCLVVTVSPNAFGLAKQDRFIIGTWGDPRLALQTTAGDNAIFQHCRDAHFNLLTGQESVYEGDFERGVLTAAAGSIHWKIDRVAQVPGLRILLMDRRHTTNFGDSLTTCTPAKVTAIKTDVNGISNSNVVMGYTMMDEPHPGTQLTAVNTWVAEFNKQDPTRICYTNLLPFHKNATIFGDVETEAWAKYGDYVDAYINPKTSSVVSFDYYPFTSGGWNNDWGTTHYFRNLNLFSTKTTANGTYFWAVPFTAVDPNYAPITAINLRFSAFAPIVYGAKGLIYYNYPLNNGGQGSDIYDWAKKINKQIETIGPLLMRLSWLGSYHQNVTDNGYTDCSFEPSLSTVPADLPLLKSFTSTGTSLMVGDFRIGTESYLLVFNKNRTAAQNLTLEFKKPVPVWELNKDTGVWTRLSASTTTIILTQTAAADMRILRLANPIITPIINLLLGD